MHFIKQQRKNICTQTPIVKRQCKFNHYILKCNRYIFNHSFVPNNTKNTLMLAKLIFYFNLQLLHLTLDNNK